MEDDPIQERFEDIEDMMDHAYEKIEDAVFHFCLCTKLSHKPIDRRIIRSALINIIETEFDETYEKLIPLIERNGNENIIYGLIKKDH